MLSPWSTGPICAGVSSTVVQPGQVSEGFKRQLHRRNAQLMAKLPDSCTLQGQKYLDTYKNASALYNIIQLS